MRNLMSALLVVMMSLTVVSCDKDNDPIQDEYQKPLHSVDIVVKTINEIEFGEVKLTIQKIGETYPRTVMMALSDDYRSAVYHWSGIEDGNYKVTVSGGVRNGFGFIGGTTNFNLPDQEDEDRIQFVF